MRLLTWIALTLVIGGCSAPTIQASGPSRRPAHTQNEPTRLDVPWQWVETPKDLQTLVFARYGVPFPDDHPFTIKVQNWINRIDTMMRKRFGDRLKNVPLPHAYVVDTKEVNAFQGVVPVCYDNPVDLPPGAGDGSSGPAPAVSLGFDLTNGFIVDFRSAAGNYSVGTSADIHCVHRQLRTLSEAQDFAAWVGANYSTCKITAVAGTDVPHLAMSPKCRPSIGDKLRHNSAARLVVGAASNWIMVFGGLILTFQDENQAVFIIAHEMSHYYRAHTVAPRSQFQFYYDQSTVLPTAPRPRPPQDPTLAKKMEATGQIIQQNAALFRGVDRARGQHYHPVIFDALVDILKDGQKAVCGTGTDCAISCAAAFAAVTSSPDGRVRFSGIYPHGAIAPEMFANLLNFEGLARKCAQDISLVDGTTNTATSISMFHALNTASTDSKFVAGTGDLPRDAQNRLLAKNLDNLLETLNAKAFATDTELGKSFQAAEDMKLGLYSFEQEADEMGNEIVHDLGLPLNTATDAILTLDTALEARFGQPYPPALTSVECAKLYHADWKDPSTGKVPFIHMGDFVDPHHTGCFRAFHFVQENALHGFEASDDRAMLQARPDLAWQNLVLELRSRQGHP